MDLEPVIKFNINTYKYTMKEGLKKALMPMFPDLRVYEIIKFVEQSSRLINIKVRFLSKAIKVVRPILQNS